MKNPISLLLLLAVFIISITLAMGCSVAVPSGNPAPTPPNPTATGTESIVGEWTGSWASSSGSSAYGRIESMNLKAVENPSGSANITGDITVTGIENASTGSIEGNLSENTINMNAQFENGPIMVMEGVYSGSTMNGTYTLLNNGQETDKGTFLASKNVKE
jgi:hypothetical protein